MIVKAVFSLLLFCGSSLSAAIPSDVQVKFAFWEKGQLSCSEQIKVVLGKVTEVCRQSLGMKNTKLFLQVIPQAKGQYKVSLQPRHQNQKSREAQNQPMELFALTNAQAYAEHGEVGALTRFQATIIQR